MPCAPGHAVPLSVSCQHSSRLPSHFFWRLPEPTCWVPALGSCVQGLEWSKATHARGAAKEPRARTRHQHGGPRWSVSVPWVGSSQKGAPTSPQGNSLCPGEEHSGCDTACLSQASWQQSGHLKHSTVSPTPFSLVVSYSRWREAEETSTGYSGREELRGMLTSPHS